MVLYGNFWVCGELLTSTVPSTVRRDRLSSQGGRGQRGGNDAGTGAHEVDLIIETSVLRNCDQNRLMVARRVDRGHLNRGRGQQCAPRCSTGGRTR